MIIKIKNQVLNKAKKYRLKLILQTIRLKLENNNNKRIIYQKNKRSNKQKSINIFFRKNE